MTCLTSHGSGAVTAITIRAIVASSSDTNSVHSSPSLTHPRLSVWIGLTMAERTRDTHVRRGRQRCERAA